ncbi:MAG: hypothetical protein VKL60_06245 [Sphaerospermopsis sp.]|uniref:Uncharacterized protein n=1 Tax=Sphaerospermopsis kisseleviana CS-549 TaxID=3021783 RepID=A0ABT4ZUS2_9CYAN|nr:hypothetical protein [Sphaerospermopsis kisseleviana]MBD2148494.1 hypothetical protein [Sphaerospermopsis sp. FACHB-1194]MDB9443155.1 hypothetical protein [Sphaerospermopsis kisseleviana CS-549]MEB3148607.1 hypothetical protein [Sphaerospermopsis sp.]BAZ81242.1 hypothetical protein NIES73_25090 [Sphaerospermopsis kisseleviana NIES-73]
MQRRCDRNRNRSKRRAIYCPVHNCYMDSMSQKYSLFAERPGQLQERGIRRKEALMLIAAKTAVPLEGEWLEAFWCEDCQETKWYHVRKRESVYHLSLAPTELWQQATGVIDPHRNPSVSEFTFKQSRVVGGNNIKDFWINNN